MGGRFKSIDLPVVAEESGSKVEARGIGAVDFGGENITPDKVYFLPFPSHGNHIMDTYTVHIDIAPTDPFLDQYRYIFAVFRKADKISDTGTAKGVGEFVTGSLLVGPTWTGNHNVRDSIALDDPIILPQGDYYMAVTIEAVNKLAGPLNITCFNCLDAFSTGFPWITESHLLGVLAVPGTLPTYMTTVDPALSALTDTFLSHDSMWGGTFFSGDNPAL